MDSEKAYLDRIKKINLDLVVLRDEKKIIGLSENVTLHLSEKIELQCVLIAKFENVLLKKKEEIQKQIEAVRGLIVIQHLLPLAISELQGETKEQLQLLSDQLTKETRTLTATLKPHLGEGQKLEV